MRAARHSHIHISLCTKASLGHITHLALSAMSVCTAATGHLQIIPTISPAFHTTTTSTASSYYYHYEDSYKHVYRKTHSTYSNTPLSGAISTASQSFVYNIKACDWIVMQTCATIIEMKWMNMPYLDI